jgi:hypothetical protein
MCTLATKGAVMMDTMSMGIVPKTMRGAAIQLDSAEDSMYVGTMKRVVLAKKKTGLSLMRPTMAALGVPQW